VNSSVHLFNSVWHRNRASQKDQPDCYQRKKEPPTPIQIVQKRNFILLIEKSVPKGETTGGRAFRNKEGNPHYPDKLDKALEMAHKAP
jgi:hypothetical protein